MQSLLHALEKEGLDYFYISDPPSLYALTGLSLSCGVALLGRKDQALWVDGRYFSHAQKKSPIPVFLLPETTLVTYWQKQKKTFPLKVGFNPHTLSVAAYEKLKTSGSEKVVWIPSSQVLQAWRSVKGEKEIEIMKQAAALNYEGICHLLSYMQEGVSEKELAWEFESFCRKKGAEKLSFDPMVAFGEGSAIPHWKTSHRKLQKGELVLVDVGIMLQGYAADCTRTFFYGKVDPFLQKLYQVVEEAKQAVFSILKPGLSMRQLDEEARKVMRKQGLEKLFLHSLGHGIGIEVHEFPKIHSVGENEGVLLKENMVITIEPGLYKAEKGGVRLEDTVRITSSGYENFYPSFFSPYAKSS